MNNECDIVKDLCIGYSENVLKDASKKMVEEHIKKCDDCKNI